MKKLVVCFVSLFFLTACTDIREIQYQAYAVGLGIDFKDNNYIVTIQFLDFLNVAKSEQGKGDQPSKVWLGNGSGKSIEDAIDQINKGIQLPLNFDQVKVIVFGESLLKSKLKPTLYALDSSYNIRLTGKVYGTDQPLSNVFTAKIPFYYPFNESQISYPNAMQQQSSTVPSLTLQKFMYQFNEKVSTILLPALSVNKEIIKEDKEDYTVPTIDGAYIIKEKEWKGFLNAKDLTGFIRVNNETVRTKLNLEYEDNQMEIELSKPKMKQVVNMDKKKPSIGLKINMDATVLSSNIRSDSNEMLKQMKKQLIEEIYSSYEKSKEIGGDIYQFENYLYRYHWDIWKSNKEEQFPPLSIDAIHINVRNFKSVPKFNSKYQS
jgi:spore germination protein KC